MEVFGSFYQPRDDHWSGKSGMKWRAQPQDIINTYLIPGLNGVGEGEEGDAVTDDIAYFFQNIAQIPAAIYDGICSLIASGGGVGTRHMHDNLQNAFLIGYALCGGQVVGTSTHKSPKPDYRRKIEDATGLNLKGFLERGYTAVRSDFRGRGIGGALIRGLIENSPDQRVYVTIRMDNTPALKMTYKEQMIHAATFINDRTGHKLGVFTNVRPGGIKG